MTICNQVATMMYGHYWSTALKNPEGLQVDAVSQMTKSWGVSPIVMFLHLDQKDYPGLLEGIANQFIKQNLTKLLPEDLQNNHTFGDMMSQGKDYFRVSTVESYKQEALNLTRPYVNKDSPIYERIALVAHIELCLENPIDTITMGADALCERAVPGYWQGSPEQGKDPWKIIDQVEILLIEIFLETIGQMQPRKT